MKKLKEKYRAMKDSIDVNVGKVVEKVFFIIVVITTFVLIPILFTTLSTLAGIGTITLTSYNIIFYVVWSILILSFLVWMFFREYKYKEVE